MRYRHPKKVAINPTKIYLNAVVIVFPFARLPLNLSKKVLIHIKIQIDSGSIHIDSNRFQIELTSIYLESIGFYLDLSYIYINATCRHKDSNMD